MIRNKNVDPNAAIAGSKVTLVGEALADGAIYIGDSNGAASEVTPSGDVTISNTGVTTIGASKVTNAMLAGSITNANLAGSITAAKMAGNDFDATQVADNADDAVIASIPVLYAVAIGAGAAADHDVTVTHKVKVIDAWFQHEGGAGEASDTIQVKNGTSAITDAADWSGSDNVIVRAAQIDDANSTISAAGTLRVTTTDNDAGGDVGAGTAYILCVRTA